MSPRRKFTRPTGKRRYKKLFVLAVEGARTEPRYFSLFNDENSIIRVSCLKGRDKSSPLQVLKRMETYLKDEALRKSDEAWLVVDKDRWTDDQLTLLFDWSRQKDNHGFAVSTPKFEFWLLLHFENGNGVSSSQNCSEKLRRYIPDYDKSIDIRNITMEMVNQAIERAKLKDNPPCEDWPRIYGSTVYRLVSRILESILNKAV